MQIDELKQRINDLIGRIRQESELLLELRDWYEAAVRSGATRARLQLAEEVTAAETKLNELKAALEAAEEDLDQREIESYQGSLGQ